MADIAPYLFLWNGVATLTGTVDADAQWCHINATMTINPSLYPYFRATTFEGGVQRPGRIAIPYETVDDEGNSLPYLFIRLPNPPYGAKILYHDDDLAPNAMTELDPGNVGVWRDANFGLGGKFLDAQVRSVHIHRISGYAGPQPVGQTIPAPLVWDTEIALGGNATRRDYFYDNYGGYVYEPSEGGWIIPPPNPLWWPTANVGINIISRGRWTYVGFLYQPSPGMVLDFDVRWWNGPGFRCDVAKMMMVD